MTLLSASEHCSMGPYSAYVVEQRTAGGFSIFEAAQPAGDFSDPPLSDYMITRVRSYGAKAQVDFGAGKFLLKNMPGDFVLQPIGQASDIIVDDFHKVSFMNLDPGLVRNPEAIGRLHSSPFRSTWLEGLLDRLWDESCASNPQGRLYADAAAVLIAVELERLGGAKMQFAKGGLAPWQLRRVKDYAMSRLDSDMSLAELAGVAGLSQFHFCRAFKQTTGLSPHRWLQMQRIERAKEMLAKADARIIEIGLSVGYANPSHFARIFRRELGLTPREFKKQLSSSLL